MTGETAKRVKTGSIAGFIFLALILFGGGWGVEFVTVVVTLGMLWEISKIIYTLNDQAEKIKVLLGTGWLFLFVSFLSPRSLVECLVISFLLLFSYFLAIANRHQENLKTHFMEFCCTGVVLVYPVSFMAFMPLIRSGANGLHWTILFFLIVWGGDTGAYFAGRKFQGQKLYPFISPGKTLSGALGGILAGMAIALLYKVLLFKNLSWIGVFSIPFIVGIVAQIGDLCESFFKRAFDVKDMGNILPGHGGLMDRFDGVLFSLPVMYFCTRVF